LGSIQSTVPTVVVTARGSPGGPAWTVVPQDPTDRSDCGPGLGLAGKGLVHHAPGDRLADLDGQFLQVRELGAPGHALGTEDIVEEMFCDPLNERLLIDHDGGWISCVSHP